MGDKIYNNNFHCSTTLLIDSLTILRLINLLYLILHITVIIITCNTTYMWRLLINPMVKNWVKRSWERKVEGLIILNKKIDISQKIVGQVKKLLRKVLSEILSLTNKYSPKP